MAGRLPHEWQLMVLEKLQPSTGAWEDFNCDLRNWQQFYNRFAIDLIDPSLFPPKPVPSDYTNLTTERTRC